MWTKVQLHGFFPWLKLNWIGNKVPVTAVVRRAHGKESTVKFDRLMEQVVGVVLLLVLAGGALFVIAPFITALLWGAILAYCSWRPFQRLTALCGGSRVLSTLIVVALILCVLIGPILYGGFAFATRIPDLTALVQARRAAAA
jgi:predicted PurR-regulated permease PerM